jgi:RNA polymerase sigma factor (sigma-70 family)
MQVTYLEAFQRIGQFTRGDPDGFLAWLACIANNNLRDAVKALGRTKRPDPARRLHALPGAANEDASQQLLLQLVGRTGTTPSRHAARAEAGALIQQMLKKLPEDYRRVVQLCDLEGREPGEAADAMGRSRAAVYMLRARAHDRLRELLGPASAFLSSP